MYDKNIVQFDPDVAQLHQMVEVTSAITATDLKDKKQLAVVKENRIALKNARVKIEKIGKEMREEAIKYQKDVIAKERELIGIIEPEEDRLKAIEEEAEQLKIREQRLSTLPAFKSRLEAIKHPREFSDEDILALSDTGRENLINTLTAQVNEMVAEETRRAQEAKERELAEQQRKIDEERRAIDHEKEVHAAAERAAKETEERIARESAEAEARAKAAEKAAEDDRIAKEKAMKNDEKYQEFLKKHGYDPKKKNNFIFVEGSPNTVWMYKLAGTFTREV